MQYFESPPSGIYRTSADDYRNVTNLRLTIEATGSPVLIKIVSADGDEEERSGLIGSSNESASVTFAFFRFKRSDLALSPYMLGTTGASSIFVPCSVLSTIDAPPVGEYVYRLQARAANKSISGGRHFASVDDVKLVAIVF